MLPRTDCCDKPIDIEVELTDELEPDSRDWEEIEDAVRDALDETPWRFQIRSRRTLNELASEGRGGKPRVKIVDRSYQDDCW